MRRFLDVARRKLVVAAAGAALLATGVGFGAAAVVSSPGTQETSDTAPITTSEAPTSETAAEPTPADTPAPTVADVTEPAATTPADQPAPETTPAPPASTGGAGGQYDPTAPFTDSAGNTYIPAPMPTMPRLPGETGYEGGGPLVTDPDIEAGG